MFVEIRRIRSFIGRVLTFSVFTPRTRVIAIVNLRIFGNTV